MYSPKENKSLFNLQQKSASVNRPLSWIWASLKMEKESMIKENSQAFIDKLTLNILLHTKLEETVAKSLPLKSKS